jgi:hypothetical protein
MLHDIIHFKVTEVAKRSLYYSILKTKYAHMFLFENKGNINFLHTRLGHIHMLYANWGQLKVEVTSKRLLLSQALCVPSFFLQGGVFYFL